MAWTAVPAGVSAVMVRTGAAGSSTRSGSSAWSWSPVGLGALRLRGRSGADAGNADLGQFAANTEEALATSI